MTEKQFDKLITPRNICSTVGGIDINYGRYEKSMLECGCVFKKWEVYEDEVTLCNKHDGQTSKDS